nr:MAG TPA: hypothetical protein [Caudoviricetes sp.]DAS50594.1 MAG TPA: hypothetical protein [Caudoviricetes sp.]DAS53775.1 MAG TPA: hypothetical protein [Caudoviricetes sp.]DAV62359.1 MAG TPA: hypothetical protein [Caudoviricetes sp.]
MIGHIGDLEQVLVSIIGQTNVLHLYTRKLVNKFLPKAM